MVQTNSDTLQGTQALMLAVLQNQNINQNQTRNRNRSEDEASSEDEEGDFTIDLKFYYAFLIQLFFLIVYTSENQFFAHVFCHLFCDYSLFLRTCVRSLIFYLYCPFHHFHPYFLFFIFIFKIFLPVVIPDQIQDPLEEFDDVR